MVVGVAVTVTVEEPDRRRSAPSGWVTNPAFSGVDVSTAADQLASSSRGSSVNVSVAPAGAGFRPRPPTPGAEPVTGRSTASRVPAGGQTRSVDHWSGWRSMSAIGARSMPLS